MTITINEGATFLVSDTLGDVPGGDELGLYHEDTRFLSRYLLRLGGHPLLLLASRAAEHFSATHVLTNPTLGSVPRGSLVITRRRMVGDGLHEDLNVENHAGANVAALLSLRFESDFAHVIAVKRHLEQREEALPADGRTTRELAHEGRSLRLRYELEDAVRRLVVDLSEAPEWRDDEAVFRLQLGPSERWHLCVDVLTLDEHDRGEPAYTCRRSPSLERAREREERRAELLADAPRLTTDAYELARGFERSLRDFAALRMKGEDVSSGELIIAAGIPWFMALFGRDSLIASYQALRFFPDVAKGTLRALARRQGRQRDPITSEEPGKIPHEDRHRVAAGVQKVIPAFPYYGTIDATPLFLILIAAVLEVTGDLDFVRGLREPALRAIAWMDRYGDRDGDGYLEYLRETDQGLANQGWKDSFDSVRSADGAIARGPIALCEVQGYAYAARLGMARVFDRLGEAERARSLRSDAAALRARFDRDFWMAERGFYAMALDGDKRQVDAITSNPGHLLWTGIVPEPKARALAERLLAPDLFSGWGVRTMAATEVAYNPVSYHRGSVWPHDNSLIVAGLARYGLVEEARGVSQGLLAALSSYPDHRLPELFSGHGRNEVDFPVEYPTACRPQAWAAGAVFLLVVEMLGLGVPIDGQQRAGEGFLPEGIDRLRVDGLVIDGRRTTAETRRTQTGVERVPATELAPAPDRPTADGRTSPGPARTVAR